VPGARMNVVVRAAILAAVVALASAGAVVGPTRQAGGATKPARQAAVRVLVELFQVALLGEEKLMFLRREAPLDRRGPDVVVAELRRGASGAGPFLDGAPAIIHSTSWRFESDGTVVLTYLAFGERPSPHAAGLAEVETMPWRQLPGLASTDPDKPRPAVLHHQDVLSHGLRHLALLARRRNNDGFAARLSKASSTFFVAIEPEIAGQIGIGFQAPRDAR
jgi:hypothetical protein